MHPFPRTSVAGSKMAADGQVWELGTRPGAGKVVGPDVLLLLLLLLLLGLKMH